MSFRYEGARAVVTGASSGIGAELARALAGRGARVFLVARRKDALDDVAADCGSDAVVHPADLSGLDAATAAGRAAVEAMGGVDVLVNCAGAPRRVHASRLTLGAVEETMRLNYLGAMAVTLAVLPDMLDAGRGRIVNVGSVAGRLPAPRESAYVASKYALTGMSEVLAMDLAGTGVAVHVVDPGVIDTPLWDVPGQEASAYRGQRVAPDAVVDAVLGLLDSGRFEAFVPGRFRWVWRLRALMGDRFLRQASRYDRRAVPEAYRRGGEQGPR